MQAIIKKLRNTVHENIQLLTPHDVGFLIKQFEFDNKQLLEDLGIERIAVDIFDDHYDNKENSYYLKLKLYERCNWTGVDIRLEV